MDAISKYCALFWRETPIPICLGTHEPMNSERRGAKHFEAIFERSLRTELF